MNRYALIFIQRCHLSLIKMPELLLRFGRYRFKPQECKNNMKNYVRTPEKIPKNNLTSARASESCDSLISVCTPH